MKGIFIGAAASFFVTAVTPAAAVDLVPVNLNHWAGVYAGLHLGVGKGNRNGCGDIGLELLGIEIFEPDPIDSCDGAPPELSFDYDQTGHLFGGQIGYNWTPSQNLLFGVEVAGSVSNIKGELDGVFGGVGTWNGLVTATAKAGFTQDRFLVYGEAGYAMGKANFEGDLGCSFTMKHSGPVAGAGVSLKVTDTASIDLKYQHIWLNAQKASCISDIFADWDPFNGFVLVPTEVRTQGHMDILKVGLNFQLGN